MSGWTLNEVGGFDVRRSELVALTLAFAQSGMGSSSVEFAVEALQAIDEFMAKQEEDTCSK